MSHPCTYRFGEWSPEEFSGEEFFIGYEDCSVSSTSIDFRYCDKPNHTNNHPLFLYPKPYQSSQWEIDYNLLWNYVKSDLLTSASIISNKISIGADPKSDLDFSKQTKYLVDLMVLFKDQLKDNPSIENYITLFGEYAISCINTRFTQVYKKPKYIKQMLKLLEISSLIHLPDNVYQLEDELDLDPIYYIAEL